VGHGIQRRLLNLLAHSSRTLKRVVAPHVRFPRKLIRGLWTCVARAIIVPRMSDFRRKEEKAEYQKRKVLVFVLDPIREDCLEYLITVPKVYARRWPLTGFPAQTCVQKMIS
jgi:hypothetical protein